MIEDVMNRRNNSNVNNVNEKHSKVSNVTEEMNDEFNIIDQSNLQLVLYDGPKNKSDDENNLIQ